MKLSEISAETVLAANNDLPDIAAMLGIPTPTGAAVISKDGEFTFVAVTYEPLPFALDALYNRIV